MMVFVDLMPQIVYEQTSYGYYTLHYFNVN